jgi:ribonuclease D
VQGPSGLGRSGTGVAQTRDSVFISAPPTKQHARADHPEMSTFHIESERDAQGLRAELAGARRLALDCEAAGFHRYSDRLCLLQLSTERSTWVIDPLAFDPAELLREALERPDVAVVMHGADFDLRLLRRDLDIGLQGLFDTQIAAQLLGEDGLGLSALLESRLGVRLSKKYQRADWAERPLSEAMLEYAADDTRYLLRLADILAGELADARRAEWAREECLALERAADGAGGASEPEDPVVRVRGAQRLSARQVTALREALEWRDEIARSRDRAPFRIVSDGPLIEAVAAAPREPRELSAIKGFPARMAQEEGADLVRRLQRVASLPDEKLRPYPKRPSGRPGRPTPEVEELAERLKKIRNRRASEVGLPKGTLLANAVVLDIARAAPTSFEELVTIEGMRRWKAEILGQDFLAAIRGAA